MGLNDLTARERGLRVLACPYAGADEINPDCPNLTIGDWLHAALVTLWAKGETFSGKRPLEKSGWEEGLRASLVKGGLIPGKWSREDQAASEYDVDVADGLIYDAIDAMRPLPESPAAPATSTAMFQNPDLIEE